MYLIFYIFRKYNFACILLVTTKQYIKNCEYDFGHSNEEPLNFLYAFNWNRIISSFPPSFQPLQLPSLEPLPCLSSFKLVASYYYCCYTYICMYVYKCLHMGAHIFVYICVHMYIKLSKFLFLCAHMHKFLLFMYVCFQGW